MAFRTFRLDDDLDLGEAKLLEEALVDALRAMASWGSSDEHMAVVASLHMMAIKEGSNAFDANERARKEAS